jgi:Protein of unknown function (DUF3987)
MTGDTSHLSISSPTLEPAARYGLPGDIVGALEPHTEADPVALLAHVLVMFGNCVGDGPHWPIGSTPHPPRLFVVLVGDAADARKGTAADAVEDLMQRAEPEWCTDRIERGIQSAEALIRRVADSTDLFGRPIITDRRLMVFESEFGRLLAVMTRSGNLSATLKTAFDGKPLQATIKNEDHSLRVTRSHISLVGHVQPEVLVERLPALEADSGFGNRILFPLVGRSQLLPHGGHVDEAVLDALADRIRIAIDAAWDLALRTTDPISRRLYEYLGMTPQVAMEQSDAFRQRWTELYGASTESPGPLNRRLPGILGKLTNRGNAHVMRLAVTYALADGAPTLEVEHLDAAFAFWLYCEESVQVVFGSETGDLNVDRLIKELRAAPDLQLTRSDVSALFHHRKTRRQLDEVCESALATGLVRRNSKETGGRPTTVYSLVEEIEGSEER